MELKGSLSNFSLPDIVQLIGTTGRTGLLIVTAGPEKASMFFQEGTIIHAEYRDLAGQEAVNRIFRENEGSFQFLADVEAPRQTVALEWMNVLMEAARLSDESQRQEGDPGEGANRGWDPEGVKAGMAEVLDRTFGKKAKKIAEELKKSPGSKLALLEFCEKAEKYIHVFIDNKRAEQVANELRAVIEESLL